MSSNTDDMPDDFFVKSEVPPQKYTASCHCNTIQYTVSLSPPLSDPTSKVVQCNCSICTRNGMLNVYVPDSHIEFQAGSQDMLTKYTFGKERVAHYFCPKCGSSLMCDSLVPGFFDGIKVINVRMFHNVDLKDLKLREIDGKSL